MSAVNHEIMNHQQRVGGGDTPIMVDVMMVEAIL
jgi:hypothetical protein